MVRCYASRCTRSRREALLVESVLQRTLVGLRLNLSMLHGVARSVIAEDLRQGCGDLVIRGPSHSSCDAPCFNLRGFSWWHEQKPPVVDIRRSGTDRIQRRT